MADVNISKYRASVVRDGSKPASPGFVVSEGQDPVNPPGTNNYVPYTGATANIELGEFGVEAGFVTLDTTPTNIPTDQGAIYWEDTRSTAALIMNGTLQHIGQDTFFYVKNSSAYTIPKGTCVRFAGTDGASGHLLILPFTANGAFPSSYFMGVTAEDIANGEFGQVMHFGELTGIDTTGYTAGALLYASSTVAGAFQTTAPVAPNNIVLVAAAVNSKVNGAIVVRPTLGSNFGTNESVKLTSVTDKDLLQYTVTAGIGVWENKTLSQVIGSAYVPSTRTITINGVTQDLSANRTFNVGTVTSVTATSPLFSSGGATPNITIQQASGSQSGFLSSTDWTTFNNKQNALTNPVTGTGTTNYLPKFTGASTIGNSQIFDNGTNVGIGTASPAAKLDIAGGDLYVRTGGTIYSNTLSPYSGNMTISLGGSGNNLIVSGGNVGIGTTNPLTRLMVQDTANTYVAHFSGLNQANGIAIGTNSSNVAVIQGYTRTFSATNNIAMQVDGGSFLINRTTNINDTVYKFIVRNSTDVNLGFGIQGGEASIESFNDAINAGTPLRIYASKLSLGLNGNVLIGTTTDNGAKLQVSGSATISTSVGINTTSPSAPLHIVTPTGVNFQNAIRFEKAGGFGEVNLENYYTSGSNYGFGIDVAGTTMMVVNNSGNAGIGTTSPTDVTNYTSLHISGKTTALGGILRSTTSDNSVIGIFLANIDGGLLSMDTNHALRFATNATERMRITSGGNVLIGTTTDNGAKLQVSGAINGTTFEATNIAFSGNVNTIFKSGFYRWNSDCTNLPESGFFAVTVYGNGFNVVAQLATHFTNGNTYVRAYNESWSTWKRLD